MCANSGRCEARQFSGTSAERGPPSPRAAVREADVARVAGAVLRAGGVRADAEVAAGDGFGHEAQLNDWRDAGRQQHVVNLAGRRVHASKGDESEETS